MIKTIISICISQGINVLFFFATQPYAWPFYEPVDAEAMGLWNYHRVIQKPMDLGTVKVKLSS